MEPRFDLYQVGFATTVITPKVGIKLAGLGARTGPSEGVYHALRAVCVAFGVGPATVLLVSVEWVGVYELTGPIRQKIARRTGLNPERILLNATHTHCGPTIRGREPVAVEYHAWAMDQIEEAAVAALMDRQPSRLCTLSGKCSIAVSRRRPDGHGGISVPMKPAPEAPHDHEVPIVSVESPEGQVRGVLFSYACHPTGMGGYLIGGDYVAYACDHLEESIPGITACFLQGCAGDQKLYADDPEGFPYLTPEGLAGKGRSLGEAVVQALADGPGCFVTGKLAYASQAIDLVTEVLPPEKVRPFLKASEAGLRAWAEYYLEARHVDKLSRTCVPLEIQTLRIGHSLALIGVAAELTVEHGLRLKRELGKHFACVMPLGYCNDLIGYVPVRRQIAEGGYEVWRSNQLKMRSGPYREDTEDRLHQRIKTMLQTEQ